MPEAQHLLDLIRRVEGDLYELTMAWESFEGAGHGNRVLASDEAPFPFDSSLDEMAARYTQWRQGLSLKVTVG